MSSTDDDILATAREGFLDEARENLAQFESALLTLEQSPDDAEALNAAFRAAHTIKGTAGLFGFDRVVAFTHDVEGVLDDMRDGRLAMSEEAGHLLLESRDQLDHLLADLGASVPDAGVAAQGESLTRRLQALRRGVGGGGKTAVAEPASTRPAVTAPAGAAAGWQISLCMGAEALRNGLDPMSFIRYLDTLGTVEALETSVEGLPALSSMDPEACYLAFSVALRTTADRAAVEAVFEFLADDCELGIAPLDGAETQACEGCDVEDAPARDEEPVAAAPVPMVERRIEGGDRRVNDAERRTGSRDRRGDETRFVRVRADKLDRLIDLIGELVIASSGAQLVAESADADRFGEAAQRIHDLVQMARDGALGLRMVPIGETFSRFHRVVRDVSKQLGKAVELQVSGGDTELDKSMVETIADPLMHLVRNSLDHGLEMPGDRVAAGKGAQGRLALHAYHESGSVVIEVSDDGRGLDRTRILAKAIERGLVAPDAALDDEAICQLIFAPGFSTAAQVTNLSGRGVGMDVVKRNVESLRGQIKVASQVGIGTTIQIRLPLTLAIIDGFLTSVGTVSYVIPLEEVVECIETPPACRSTADANPSAASGCFDLRGEVLPYLDLRRVFRQTGERPARQSMVIVRTARHKVGLLVDRLHGEHQTVIKPLGRVFAHLKGIAGSTILGSGEVALVLDVPALLEPAAGRERAASRPA